MAQQIGAGELVEKVKQYVKGRLQGLPIEELVLPDRELDLLARHFSKTLKATQLRRVFHDLKRLEQQARRGRRNFNEVRTELALTLPELAYAFGRDLIPREFYELMRTLLHPPQERFRDYEDVQRLVQVLTALLAYHKFYGGR